MANVHDSTIIVSIARLWALAQYGSSTNPIYDNMLSGIFSPLELNVGIIAMCMPAFRRFVARFLPSCFGSTFGSYTPNAKYTPEGETPDSSKKGSRGRRRANDTLKGSLFQTTIMKTVDTRVEEVRSSEDQVRLVELEIGKDGTTTMGKAYLQAEEGSQHQAESLYKQQHERTVSKDW